MEARLFAWHTACCFLPPFAVGPFTRDAATASHGALVPVGTFSAIEARAYLEEKFAGQPGRLVEADELAADVGYLPLMLGQAAAFIANVNIRCAEYRQRLKAASKLLDVVPEEGRVPDDYRQTVAAQPSASTGLSTPRPPRLRTWV